MCFFIDLEMVIPWVFGKPQVQGGTLRWEWLLRPNRVEMLPVDQGHNLVRLSLCIALISQLSKRELALMQADTVVGISCIFATHQQVASCKAELEGVCIVKKLCLAICKYTSMNLTTAGSKPTANVTELLCTGKKYSCMHAEYACMRIFCC